MRKVGEGYIGQIPNHHRTREQVKNNKKNNKKNVLQVCRNEGCENTFETSVNQIRGNGAGDNNMSCYDCWKKGKKEMNQALIALAKRKGLI